MVNIIYCFMTILQGIVFVMIMSNKGKFRNKGDKKMEKWNYVQFDKCIAECYFDDDFVKKLEDKNLKGQFSIELHELIYKYTFQIGGLSREAENDSKRH